MKGGSKLALDYRTCMASGMLSYTEGEELGQVFFKAGRLDSPFVIHRIGDSLLAMQILCKTCDRLVWP